MSNVAALQELLKKQFGITNEKELDEALRKMKPLDIGVFLSPRNPKKEALSMVAIEYSKTAIAEKCYG